MTVLVLTVAELRSCITMDQASLEQVENAFTWISQGRVSMPPVMHIEVDAQSDVDIKGFDQIYLANFTVDVVGSSTRP